MQWVLLYLVMRGLTENISHSAATLCGSIIMHSFSYNSQTDVSGHMLLRTLFLVSICGTRAQSLSAPFRYTLLSRLMGIGKYFRS
jgi:hypothetical protein